MTENQKNTEEGWVMLNAKVPPHIGTLFNILARQRGMTSYELLQLLINGFITAARHEGPVTPELRLLIDSLKLDVAFSKAFNFASPTATAEIAQMILILQQPGRKGFGLMMIDRPFMGDATVTHCVDDIFERVVKLSMPGIDHRLEWIEKEFHCTSRRETLILICEYMADYMKKEEELNEMPGFDNFHDFGKQVEYGKRYKRKPRRTPDSLANSQQRIVFDDYDREVAGDEAERGNIEDELGCKPFGYES